MKRIAITVVAVWFLALGGCGKKESQLVSGDSAVLVGTLELNVHGYELKLMEGKHFSGEDICDEGMRQSVWLSGEQKILDAYVGKAVEVAGRLGCPRGGWIFAADKVAELKSKDGAQRKTIAYTGADLAGTYICRREILANKTQTIHSVKYDADGTYVALDQSKIDGGKWDINWVEVGTFKLEWPRVSTIRRGVAIFPNLYGWEADTDFSVSLEKVLETNDLKRGYKVRVTKRIVDGEIQSDDYSHPVWTNECDRNESAELSSGMDDFKRQVKFRGSGQNNLRSSKRDNLDAAISDFAKAIVKLEQSPILVCKGYAKGYQQAFDSVVRNSYPGMEDTFVRIARLHTAQAIRAYKICTCKGDHKRCVEASH